LSAGESNPGTAIGQKLLLAPSDAGNPINRNPLHGTFEPCGRIKTCRFMDAGAGGGIAKASHSQAAPPSFPDAIASSTMVRGKTD